MRATFNVMFFVQKGKCKADGTAPILARLTVNQEKIHFSTKQSIDPQRWDAKRYRTLGVTKAEKNINGMLDELQASIQRHFFDRFIDDYEKLVVTQDMDTRVSFATRYARTEAWHLSIKNTRPLTSLCPISASVSLINYISTSGQKGSSTITQQSSSCTGSQRSSRWRGIMAG